MDRMPTDEIDFAAAKPGILVILAGALMVFAGATTFVQGLQLWTVFVLYGYMRIVPWVLMPLGLLQMALGATSSAGRDWAAILGLVVTWFIQILALAFTIWSLSGGLIVLAFVWVFINGLASLLAPIAIPGALKASKVRRQLYT